MTESPRAAVLSNDQVADILSKPYRDQWTLVRTVEAAVLAQARAVDAGSEPLPDYQLNAIALEVLSTLGPVARLPPGWIETARAIEIAVRRALTTPAVDVPDCDTCAHAALKESQEPCSSCVPYAPARPMWTPKATAPAAAGAAPTVKPPANWEGAEEWMPLAWELCADENGEDACNELVWEGGPIPEPWGDRWLKYEDEAKRMIALVRKTLAATQPAGETQAAEGAYGDESWSEVLASVIHCARQQWNGGWAYTPEEVVAKFPALSRPAAGALTEASFAWPVMPQSKGQSPVLFEDGYAEGWAKCDAQYRAALALPAAGVGEGLTPSQIDAVLDALHTKARENFGVTYGLPLHYGSSRALMRETLRAALSTRTAQGGQE